MEDSQIRVHGQETADEEFTIELESDTIQSSLLAKRSLLGRILSQKPLNRGAVKNILAKAWEGYGDFQIIDMGKNLFLFSFSDKKEALEIIKKGPWFIMGFLLSLQFWVPEAAIYEVDFDHISFWIQIHGLPLEVMNTGNAAKIIGKIGDVLEVENPEVEGKLLRTFFRVRARVNIKKPLVTGCWVPRKNLQEVWIMFKYERLQGLCFNCGVIGHEQKSCSHAQVMSHLDNKNPKYSAKLGVAPARPILQLFQEQGQWRNKRKEDFEKKQGDHNGNTDKTPDPTQGDNQSTTCQEQGGTQMAEYEMVRNLPPQFNLAEPQRVVDEVVADKGMQEGQNVRKEQQPDREKINANKASNSQPPTLSAPPPYKHAYGFGPLGPQLRILLSKKFMNHQLNQYEGAMLSVTEIRTCKGKIKQSLAQKGQQDRGDKGKECHTPYFVEFLDDEDNEDPPTPSNHPSNRRRKLNSLWAGTNLFH
ncbi:Zinc finger, CCHC-type [Sesbania bispinosa]|nr:Zinc finger, CCHC-type [Sesbania bispinosa]